MIGILVGTVLVGIPAGSYMIAPQCTMAIDGSDELFRFAGTETYRHRSKLSGLKTKKDDG